MSVSAVHRISKLPTVRRIAILRALQLGDLLCAVPAFRALRAAFPRAQIVLIGLPWAKEFVRRYASYLDGFREFPGYPGLPERVPQKQRIPQFVAAIQAEQFDFVLQLHGSGSIVNPLVAMLAEQTGGFFTPGDYCPDAKYYLRYPDSGLEIRRLLQLVEFLGLPLQGEHLEFPLDDRDYQELACIPDASRLAAGNYICVHPGASIAERRWPTERFAAVADELAADGFQVVLTGVAHEIPLTKAVRRAMRHPAVDLAGQTTLGAAAALLQGARLLVCNDTGVSHLAAALQLPSVVLATGNNPARWAPIDAIRHRVLAPSADCQPRDVLHECRMLLQSSAERIESIGELIIG